MPCCSPDAVLLGGHGVEVLPRPEHGLLQWVLGDLPVAAGAADEKSQKRRGVPAEEDLLAIRIYRLAIFPDQRLRGRPC